MPNMSVVTKLLSFTTGEIYYTCLKVERVELCITLQCNPAVLRNSTTLKVNTSATIWLGPFFSGSRPASTAVPWTLEHIFWSSIMKTNKEFLIRGSQNYHVSIEKCFKYLDNHRH